MIEADKLNAELEKEQELLEDLVYRSIQQKKDIIELREALNDLQEDIADTEERAIRSEQVEG